MNIRYESDFGDEEETKELTVIAVKPGSRITVTGGCEDDGRHWVYAGQGGVNNGQYTMIISGSIEVVLIDGPAESSFKSPDALFEMTDDSFSGNYLVVLDAPYFSDVPSNSYYLDSLKWAVENDITNGTGGSMFSPNRICTRAQIITMLWRANDCPYGNTDIVFSDVSCDDYFYNSVLWAYAKGFVSGGKFNGQKDCTRAEVVTYLVYDYCDNRAARQNGTGGG